MHTFEFSHSCSSSSSTQITFGMFAAAKHTGTGLCTISARIYVMECVLYDMLQWSAHCTCNDAQNGATAPHACLTLCCCSCNCCRLSRPRVSPRFSSRDRSSDQPITSRTSRMMRSRKKTRRTRTQPCGDVPSNNPFVDVCSAIGTLTLRIGMLRKREGVKTTSSETCFLLGLLVVCVGFVWCAFPDNHHRASRRHLRTLEWSSVAAEEQHTHIVTHTHTPGHHSDHSAGWHMVCMR